MKAGKESSEDEGRMLALYPGHFEGNGETAGRAGDPRAPSQSAKGGNSFLPQQSCSEPWLAPGSVLLAGQLGGQAKEGGLAQKSPSSGH